MQASAPGKNPIAYRVGDLIVDTGRACVSRNGVDLPLPRLSFDLLVALIEAAPNLVTADELVERVWSGRVVSPETVSQRVKLLRDALGDDARRPRYVGAVRSRGYRLTADVAPVPEETGTAAAAAGSPVPVAGPARKPLLAVLPFEDLSADPDLLYFSDGLSEEILQTVARTTRIRVVGLSSSFQFRGAAKAATNVARELNATHVLDGSVRRSGQRVRIVAQLIECDSQTTLWSHRFERELSEVFALQDDIARAVGHALRSAFSPTTHLEAIDPIAFDLYLRAITAAPSYVGAYDSELLEAAVAREPRLPGAWAALAMSRAIQAQDSGMIMGTLPTERVANLRRLARHAAERALALDPGAAPAHAALAALEPVAGAFARSHEHLARALSAAPDDPSALIRMSRWCESVGRIADAARFVARAFEIDPLSPNVANVQGTMLAAAGRIAESEEIFDANRRRWPDVEYAALTPLYIAAFLRNWPRVDRLRTDIVTRGPDTPYVRDAIARLDLARDRPDEAARRRLATMRESLATSGTVSLNAASDACNLGCPDEALELLEQASFDHLFQPGGRLLPGDFGVHQLFRGLFAAIHRRRRFVALCSRSGLCDYWVESDRWPDCAERLSEHYDFEREARRLAARPSTKIH